jgi:hypothetical protein
MSSEDHKKTTGTGPSPVTADDRFAEIRAYMVGEFSRMKDDVSDLYEKLNSLKDATTAERIQLIAQFTQEYRAFNDRLNNFSTVMQQLVSDAEHSDSSHASELRQILTEVDNKLLRCKLDIRDIDHSPDIESLKQRVALLENRIQQIPQLPQMQGNDSGVSKSDFEALKKTVSSVAKKESATTSKLQKMGWRLSLVIGALLYILDKFGTPIIKAGLSNAFASKATPTVVVDTVEVDMTKPKKLPSQTAHFVVPEAAPDAAKPQP